MREGGCNELSDKDGSVRRRSSQLQMGLHAVFQTFSLFFCLVYGDLYGRLFSGWSVDRRSLKVNGVLKL